MQFLSLYTPAVAPKGPPDPQHMARMMKLIEQMTRSDALVATAGIMSRSTAMKVAGQSGKFTVEDGPVVCAYPSRVRGPVMCSRSRPA